MVSKTLFVDMDGVLCDCWQRIGRTFSYTVENIAKDRPIYSAFNAMEEFRRAGWSITVLTARPFDLNGHITRTWLTVHGISYDRVVVVESAEQKADYLKGYQKGNADPSNLFVDDFIGGYETGLPKFVCHVYEDCRQVVRTEPFRNNWPEIVERYTGVKIDVRAI